MSARTSSSSRNLLITSCAVGALMLGAAPAKAQSDAPAASAAPTGGLEEIVVTAERRTTNLQTTPISISALKADTLEKANVTQLAEINGRIPSLEITKSSGYETVVTIRGVGLETPENALNTSPGVALFVDGVYVANTISLDQTLFDIDHVEVIRGPQGALYGQSSTGGAISIVTKQPVLNELSGFADVTFGDYNLHRERAEVNVPIGDTFAIRASAQEYAHDGFTHNNFLKNHDVDDAGDTSGKIAAMWKPFDDFKATLTTQFYSASFNGNAQKNINDPNPDPRVISQDYPTLFRLNTNLTHLNLEYETPWFTIKSITAYQYLQHNQRMDGDRSTFANIGFYDDVAAWNTKMYNWNQEFDLVSNDDGPFEWITGIFLLSQKTQQYVTEFGGSTPPTAAEITPYPQLEYYGSNPYPGISYGNLTFGEKLQAHRYAYAWFAQGTYHITDDLRLTGGVRVNYDSGDVWRTGFGDCYGTQPYGEACRTKSSSWSLIPTWIGRLEYDVTPDNMLYASFTRGYKPGGPNSSSGYFATPGLNPGGIPAYGISNYTGFKAFTPETNTAFEVGAKNSFLDKHLTLNVSAFYYVYKNMQFLYTDPIPYSGGIGNIPSTHIWGGEVESTYTGGPENRFRAEASLGVEEGEVNGDTYLLDSTITNRIIGSNPACAFGVPPSYAGPYGQPGCWAAELKGLRNVAGNEPAKMPNVTASLALSYDFPVYGGTLTPRVEYIYRGAFWQRIFAEPSVDRVPSYDLVNLNFTYVPEDAPWKVQFTITNLFDEAGVNSRYTDPYGTAQTSEQFIPPRQIMGTISYAFGPYGSEPESEPAAYVPPPVQPPVAPKSYLVFFDFNKSDLTPQAVDIVNTAAKNAAAGKVTQLTVTGHTDTVGSDAYNMRLSRRRAESVAAQLEKDGVAASEISIVAKGKRDLLVPTADGVREPQNRRVQIVFDGGPAS